MSENIREITLAEAKKLYNSSEEAKAFLLSKFTKDELEGKNIPTQEEFNKFFEENILSQIDYSKTKFLDFIGFVSKTPTSRIELYNLNGKWLFDYNYEQKNKHFYFSYDTVYHMLFEHFLLACDEAEQLVKSIIADHFNLQGVTPSFWLKSK